MTEVILYDTDNTVWKLDVTSTVAIPLNFSITDVREPDKTKGTWSKTASFTGTANNNKAFKHVYEISGESDFNVNKKVRAVIIEHGINTFVGYCRLLNIKRKNNGHNDYNRIVYELSFFGESADFFKELTGLYLHDLDFSEWNHLYTRPVQINSLSGNTVLNNVTGQNSITLSAAKSVTSFGYNGGYLQLNFSASHGLVAGDEIYIAKTDNTNNAQYNGSFFVKSVESATQLTVWMVYGANVGTETATAYKVTMLGAGYVYTMIDYGMNLGTDWDVEHFFPAIYVKEYWDKIFSGAGYTYESDFLDSQFFKHLVIPFNRDTFQISAQEVLDREFRAGYDADDDFQVDYDSGQLYIFSITHDIIPTNDSTNGNNDANGVYNTGTGEYTAPETGYYDFNWNINVDINLDAVPMGYTRNASSNYASVIVKVNGTSVHSQAYISAVTNNQYNYIGNTPSLLLTSGDVVTFEFVSNIIYQLIDTSGTYYTAQMQMTSEIMQGTYIQCKMVNVLINEGATVNLNNAVPREYLQSDFITSIIKMFKLFVQPSPEDSKKLLIEPRDTFFSSNVIDWTDKLDINKDISILPMGELNSKRYIFKYKGDKDAFNQNHEEYYGEVYGTQLIDIDNDFVTGETVLEPIFSASPLIDFPVGTDRVITSIVKEGTVSQNRIASNIRILFYAARGTQFPYNYVNNAGVSTNYTYGYAGHLDNVWLPYYDLNFGFPKGVYYNYGAWTDNNLYNRFHRQYIEEITDRHSKIVTAWIHLKPSDINNLDFSVPIRIDKHLLRLNKIMDYLPDNNGTTLCEFVKIKSGYTWTPTSEAVSNGSGAVLGGLSIPIPSFWSSLGGNVQRPRDGGYRNYYGGNNSGVTVNGNNNIIGFGVRNAFVAGDNNTIYGNVYNVFVFGDGNNVLNSNSTYRNGVCVEGEGSITYITTNTNLVKGTSNITRFNEVDCTGGNITIYLPAANTLIGVILDFKKIDSSVNTFTLDGDGSSDLIDGSLTYIVTSQYDNISIFSDGVKWNII